MQSYQWWSGIANPHGYRHSTTFTPSAPCCDCSLVRLSDVWHYWKAGRVRLQTGKRAGIGRRRIEDHILFWYDTSLSWLFDAILTWPFVPQARLRRGATSSSGDDRALRLPMCSLNTPDPRRPSLGAARTCVAFQATSRRRLPLVSARTGPFRCCVDYFVSQ